MMKRRRVIKHKVSRGGHYLGTEEGYDNRSIFMILMTLTISGLLIALGYFIAISNVFVRN